MRDPRALANTKNLRSYRAWEREGYQRSGFLAVVMLVPLLLTAFGSAATRFGHAGHAGRFSVLTGGTFALLLAISLGAMLFAVLRLNAWKRAHAWAPPAR